MAAIEHTATRLYVQNLPSYVDSARLREHFAAQGDVTDACVIRTKDGSRSRRFGFVGFKSDTQAEQARRFFHQSFFDTCKINVSVALAVRNTWPAGIRAVDRLSVVRRVCGS